MSGACRIGPGRDAGRTGHRGTSGPLARAALIAAAAMLLSGCAVARQALYAPLEEASAPPSWRHGPPAEIEATVRGAPALRGYFWPGTPGDPDIFIFFHGRHMNAVTGAKYAQHLLGKGDAVLVASYRGYGGNEGSPNEAGMMRDAAAFIARARQLMGPGARLWLVGHSIGSAVAIHAAANDNATRAHGPTAIRGIFAISAFTRISQAVPRVMRWMVPDPWNNLTALGAVDLPIVFFQGARDSHIPADNGPALLAAASPPALLLLGAETAHNPDMSVLGPWIRDAAGTMLDGTLARLPAEPEGWSQEARRP